MQKEKEPEQKKNKITIFIPGTFQSHFLASRFKNLLGYFSFSKCSFKYDRVARTFASSFGTYSLNKEEGKADFYSFSWNGGPLSEFARKEAAEALYLLIKNEFPKGDLDIDFLCQSHGGNVFGLFLNTLKQMREREDKELSSVEVARNISVHSAVLWETPKYNGGINKYAGLCYQDGRFIAPRIYDVNLNGFGLNEGNFACWGTQRMDLSSGGFWPCHRKLLKARENISRVTLECDPIELRLTHNSFNEFLGDTGFMYKEKGKFYLMEHDVINAHGFLIFLQGLEEKKLLVSGENENLITSDCLKKSFREGDTKREEAEAVRLLAEHARGEIAFLSAEENRLISDCKKNLVFQKDWLDKLPPQLQEQVTKGMKKEIKLCTLEEGMGGQEAINFLQKRVKAENTTQYRAEDVRCAKHDYDYMHCITHNKKYFLSCLLALFLLKKYVNNDLKGLVERNYRKILAAVFAIMFFAG